MALLVIDTSLNGNQGQTVLGQCEGHGRLQNMHSGLLLFFFGGVGTKKKKLKKKTYTFDQEL